MIDYNKTKTMYNEIEKKEALVRQLNNEIEIETYKYRIESVGRVLGYINDLCWSKKVEEKQLNTYIVHCLNKLNGNIDGVELSLENLNNVNNGKLL